MKFDKYIKIGVLGIALWSLTGCTDWLDVQPVDQVAEEQMFTSEDPVTFVTQKSGFELRLPVSIFQDHIQH